MSSNMKTAVVLDASPKPERYSNQAVAALLEKGFEVVPVNPTGAEIHGKKSVKSLSDVESPVDVLTVYVNAGRSSEMADSIIGLAPKLVIFNPGAENGELAAKLAAAGMETEDACTLILLNTGQLTAERID